MADKTTTLKMLLVGEDRSAGKALRGLGDDADHAGRKMSGVSSAAGMVKGALVGLVAAASVGPLIEGFKATTGAASDLNETVSKAKTIFGDSFGVMDQWSNGAAKSMGLSKQAALDASAGFGDMFLQLGFAGDSARKMSQDVVQMSADLGSFNNLPTAEVTDMIAASFRGEYDSLQRLIPNISASRVETEALAATGKKSAKELTAQEKAAATLAIVQRDGARAAGDFAKTSDGAANKAKINAARTAELSAAFGGLLGPVQAVAQDGFDQLLSAGEGVTAWLKENPAVIEGFAAGLSLAGDVLKGLAMIAAPVFAILVEGFAGVVDGVAAFLEGLSHVPGFEWAGPAAQKVKAIGEGAHAAARGLEVFTNQAWGLTGALGKVPAVTEAKVLAPGAKPSKADVDALVRSVGRVPGVTEAEIRTTADTYGVEVAKKAIASVKSQTVTIRVNYVGSTASLRGSAYVAVAKADGGLVQRFDAGGQVAGWSPHDRADNIPAMLTAREYVHPVAAVDHYGVAAMEAVRTRRATISYGDGGLVAGAGARGGASERPILLTTQLVVDGKVLAETVRRHNRSI